MKKEEENVKWSILGFRYEEVFVKFTWEKRMQRQREMKMDN